MASNEAEPDHESAGEAESSLQLLQRAQLGDSEAVNLLMARYLPRLRRWASGRLPRAARDLADTTDLVQNTLLQTFKRIETLQAGRDQGLQAYLRRAVVNGIRDELRRARRRPRIDPLAPTHADPGPSPLELAIGQETVDRYERALAALRPQERDAVIARIDLGCTYAEVARMLGKPSTNAARMAVERAIVRLIDEMRRDRERSS
jgi:RNA polymerase sigma-70 factor (ECF subfamily)